MVEMIAATPMDDAARRLLTVPGERWGWEYRRARPCPERDYPPPLTPPDDYAERYAAWKRRILYDEDRQWEVVGPQRFFPVGFARTPLPSTVAVFGGDTYAWDALLTTLGGSLLGSGQRVAAVDLSRRRVGAGLRGLARQAGYTEAADRVAPGASSLDLFAYPNADELVAFLLDVLQPASGAQGRAEALADRDVLRAAGARLDPPVTLPRLHAALRLIVREDVAEAERLTSPEEQARLYGMYGPEVRQQADVVGRAHRLQREIGNLLAFAPRAASAPADPTADVHLVEADAAAARWDFELLCEILAQSLPRWLARAGVRAGKPVVFVVLGADNLPRPIVETLATAAAQGAGRLVLIFERLRGEIVDALGIEDAAFAFMRLTDHREAEVAGNFIGKRHRFVLSQTSYQRSTQRGITANEHRDTSFSLQGSGVTEGQGTARQSGESTTTGVTIGRSLEYLVDPYQFQEMPQTGVFLVDLQSGRRRIVNCDPLVVAGPIPVSPYPYPFDNPDSL